MSSRFIYVVTSIKMPFTSKAEEIPSDAFTVFYLSNEEHWVASTFWLLSNDNTHGCASVCVALFILCPSF